MYARHLLGDPDCASELVRSWKLESSGSLRIVEDGGRAEGVPFVADLSIDR